MTGFQIQATIAVLVSGIVVLLAPLAT